MTPDTYLCKKGHAFVSVCPSVLLKYLLYGYIFTKLKGKWNMECITNLVTVDESASDVIGDE